MSPKEVPWTPIEISFSDLDDLSERTGLILCAPGEGNIEGRRVRLSKDNSPGNEILNDGNRYRALPIEDPEGADE